MTHVRTIAPMVADFSLVPGTETRDPERYAALWSGLASSTDLQWTHTHAVDSGFQRYRSIADDSLRRTLHVGEIQPAVDTLPAEFDDVRGVLSDVLIRLFDHGIATVEASFDVDAWLAGAQLDASALDRLQTLVVDATTRLARHVSTEILAPALVVAREADDRGEIVDDALADPHRSAVGQVLWVSRALVLDAASVDAAVVTHWLKDTELSAACVADVIAGRRSNAVQWLNYVYIEKAAAWSKPPEEWDALRYAQYFYAALDVTDTRLSEVLARAGGSAARRVLDELNSELAVLSHRAEMIIMLRDDVSKYLTRSVRTAMEKILEGWEHKTLVEEPVKFKIELCDRRLRGLVDERAERSAMFTDVILLGIAVTSILGTALTFTEFGRASATDPALAGYDVSRSSVTQWVASQSADTILLVSGAISALVVLLFLMFRRTSNR